MKVVNVHQLHLLIPTLPTFTNLTYYHAPKALRMNSIEGIVFGHGIVFVGRWCWRPPSGSGAGITHDVAAAFGRGEYGGSPAILRSRRISA